MGMNIKYINVETIYGKKILETNTLSFKKAIYNEIKGVNGIGKTVFLKVIVGLGNYFLNIDNIIIDGNDLKSILLHEKFNKGIFLFHQYPILILTIKYIDFLK